MKASIHGIEHYPVLYREVLLSLPAQLTTMLDGTLGHAGHARLILEERPQLETYFGLDQDPSVHEWFRDYPLDPRLQLIHANFADAQSLDCEPGSLDAVLLDLGTSTQQLKDSQRGFSFIHAGPLDMRMDTSTGETLGEWLLRVDEREMTRVLRQYGEEPFARPIARKIMQGRVGLKTTVELAELIESAVPRKVRQKMKIHAATRAFQAFRIALNEELEVLEEALDFWLERLRAGGRLLVISFHSLEDRCVKNRFRDWADEILKEGLFGPTGVLKPSLGRRVSRKAIKPSEEELQANPPSRSARLRVFEKGGVHGAP